MNRTDVKSQQKQVGISPIKHFLEDPTVTPHTQGKTHIFGSLDPAVLLDPVSHCHNSLLHKPKALCTAACQAQLTAVRAELGELSPAPGEGRWPDGLLLRSLPQLPGETTDPRTGGGDHILSIYRKQSGLAKQS